MFNQCLIKYFPIKYFQVPFPQNTKYRKKEIITKIIIIFTLRVILLKNTMFSFLFTFTLSGILLLHFRVVLFHHLLFCKKQMNYIHFCQILDTSEALTDGMKYSVTLVALLYISPPTLTFFSELLKKVDQVIC